MPGEEPISYIYLESELSRMEATVMNSTILLESNISLVSTFYGSEGLYKFHNWYAKYHGFVSILVCIYGIITNIFNIIVLTRKNMINPCNLILLGLAVSDLLTMILYVPFVLYFYCIYGTEPTPERNSKGSMKFFIFHVNFTVTTHTVSIWMGVCLAIFRYLHIKYSMDSSVLVVISVTRAKLTIMAVFISSVIILIPNYLSLKIVELTTLTNGRNHTLYDVYPRDRTSHPGNVIITLNFWIQAILVKMIPCGLMLVFGLILVKTVSTSHRRTKRLRQNSRPEFYRSRSREHSRTTKMMVIIIALFLITELPQGILVLVSELVPGFFKAYYVPLGDAMDIIALLNNAINFTLYCTMSKQFRQTFLQLFCPWSVNTTPFTSDHLHLTDRSTLVENEVSDKSYM